MSRVKSLAPVRFLYFAPNRASKRVGTEPLSFWLGEPLALCGIGFGQRPTIGFEILPSAFYFSGDGYEVREESPD